MAKQTKAPLELTEEMVCFSELRQHLLTRLTRARKEEDSKRADRLSKQALIVRNHILSLFQEREKLS